MACLYQAAWSILTTFTSALPNVHHEARAFSAYAPGCIIQLHAGVAETVDALPEIVTAARRQGYEFALIK